MYGKMFIPRIENKNKTKNKSPPIFARAGNVKIKVENIILKLLALLTNRRTLTILKDLRMEAEEPNWD
jgi:hypothetical protein